MRKNLLWVTLLSLAVTCSAIDDDAVIEKLVEAHKAMQLINPVSHVFGEFSMEEAYRIQKKLALQIEKHAGPVVGYKVAYASRAAQEQFQMSEPARGPFYLTQRVPSGSTLPADLFRSIMLETEIAFTIGKPIDGPIGSVEELQPHVKWVHAALDAGNFPFKTDVAKPGPADMVASGTGAHLFVFGAPMDPSTVDLQSLTTVLMRNGETIREAPAKDIMGNPWKSLLWCANHLHEQGLSLQPGMVVFSGTAAKAYKATGDEIQGTYVGDCGPLGTVHLTLE